MPFVRLTMTPAQSPDKLAGLVTALTDLVATKLAKRHDLTSVLVETPMAAHWAVNAVPQPVAAHLTVCVTAGTNSVAQKRDFIQAAMAALRQALPGLPVATYVVIREIAGTDWGYNGQTQTDRAATAH